MRVTEGNRCVEIRIGNGRTNRWTLLFYRDGKYLGSESVDGDVEEAKGRANEYLAFLVGSDGE